MEAPRCATLYCTNLDDQIHERDMRSNLFEFFVAHGEILGIQCARSKKLRGQAFVIFKEVSSATAAFRKMQGRMFMEKPIQIAYAKTQSNITALLNGTYQARPGKQPMEEPKEITQDNNTPTV